MGKAKKKKEYPSKQFARDIWSVVEGQRLKLVFLVALRALSELAPFAILFFLGLIIDFFTKFQAGDSLTVFYWYVGSIGILGVLQVWTRMFAKMQISIIGAKTRRKLREASMTHLMDLELAWHEQEGTGSKIQKINQGSHLVYRFFSQYINNRAVSVLVGMLGSLTLFLFLGLKYALFGFVYLAIFLVIERYYSKKLSYWMDEMNKIAEKVSGKIHESASNVLSVKSLGLRSMFEDSTKKHEQQ